MVLCIGGSGLRIEKLSMSNRKVILLSGISANGKTSPGAGMSSKYFGKYLTPAMGKPINNLRIWANAVIVSANTLITDNPRLICEDNPDLVRVVIDRFGQLTSNEYEALSNSAKTLIYTSVTKHPLADSQTVIKVSKQNFLTHVINDLEAQGLKHILVEAGERLGLAMIGEQLVDEIVCGIFPFFVADTAAPGWMLANYHKKGTVFDNITLQGIEVIDGAIIATYGVQYG